MKKALFLIILYGMMAENFGQPQINSPTYPNSVGLFDLFEVSFTMGVSYSNPYDPDTIDVFAIFIGPDNSIYKVGAFYYEDYTFQKTTGNNFYEQVLDSLNEVGGRIRVTPTQIGNWRFRIIAKDVNGKATQPTVGMRSYNNFSCTSVDNADGFISLANSRYLKRDIVRNNVRHFHSFFPIGPNLAWYNCRDYGTFAKPIGIISIT